METQTMQKKTANRVRTEEAPGLILALLEGGWQMAEIASAVGVDVRTPYRWRDEAKEPHPTLLAALRRLKPDRPPSRAKALKAQKETHVDPEGAVGED